VLIAPGHMSHHMQQKNREQGIDAVSRGLIAVNAGDAALAKKLANKASRKLKSDSLSILLKAQAAQLAGDRNTARRLYEAMLENPETEAAGLRGLYLEARREKQIEAARQFAQKALDRNPKLTWANQALLEIQSRSGQWAEALKTLELAQKHNKVDKELANRQRAVLLTAQALELEQHDSDKAVSLALDAHKLAANLVPAANVAGRILAAQGNVRKAAKVIETTWDVAPHPDLALTYAHARPGDSPRDRLLRVRQLADRTPYNMEGPIAIAQAAIESHDWDEARKALKSLLSKQPTARACTLMARIEGGQYGDKGRVREWLAKAVRAPRDPAWTADGYVSEHWAPVSPITGRLDAFEWRVPVERLESPEEELPFDEFIPLKAEESVPKDIEDVAPAITVAASPVVADAGSEPDATDATAEAAPAEPAVTVVPAEEILPPAPADDTEEPQSPAPSGSPAPQADKQEATTVHDDADIEDAQTIEPPKSDGAAPEEDKPSAPPARVSTTSTESVDRSEDRDIYIPPRLPDDPGPLNGNGENGKGGSHRLPQRYRQSS
jgi:HemY protein